jgi:hypothetical protein
VVSARTRSINSRCGRGWLALLARCLVSLVILAGVALVFSGPALTQEPAPGGPAPTADPPIDAGIDRAKFEPFSKALRDVEVLEGEVEDLARRIVEAEAIVKLAEQGLSVKSLDTARSDLDTEKAELKRKERKLKEARDKLEEERQKLSPDDRVDLAIVNLAERLWEDGVWVNEFLAGRTVYRTREEVPLRLGGGVPLTDVEHYVACWLAIADLGQELANGGASDDALKRWAEARAKAWKIITARVDAIVKKLEQTDLFQQGYNFMHAVYHRALAKVGHENRRAGLAGAGRLELIFKVPCPGAGCPEEKRQRGQTR